MASKTQALMLLLLPYLLLSHLSSSQAAASCPIVTYWGQNVTEGELQAACDTGNYEIINIAFLTTFGNRQPPSINLAGHCNWNTPSGKPDCTGYAFQRKHCQEVKKVKIFLSLGGARGQYTLSSKDDAKNVAEYLWNNYLRDDGQNPEISPIGRVVLDGIDFDIVDAGGTLYCDDLVKALDSYRSKRKTPFYLSAAPQCFLPDRHLDAAIKTELFDYIWIQFYNNPPCQYSYVDTNHTKKLLDSWTDWTTKFKAKKFYVGLPASPDTNYSAGGYAPIDKVNSEILPGAKKSSKFGGFMIWSYNYDKTSKYSEKIECTPYGAFNVVREPLVALMKSASEVLHRPSSQF